MIRGLHFNVIFEIFKQSSWVSKNIIQYVQFDGRILRSSMALRAVRFVVRSRKLEQRRSVIGWVTKNLLSRASPCFGSHIKPLVPAVLAVVRPTNPHWARVVGYGQFSLCVIHKKALCPSCGDINRLMMIILLLY
jgi:hypothetical protein